MTSQDRAGSSWPTGKPEPPKRGKGRLVAWVVITLLLIVVISALSARSKPAVPDYPKSGGVAGLGGVTASAGRKASEIGSQLGQAITHAASPASTPPPVPQQVTPPRGIGDGTFEVGADVPAGKYKTTGPDPDELIPNCYFARLHRNDGSLNDIIQNNNSKGPVVVTLKVGEYFETQGCAEWVKV